MSGIDANKKKAVESYVAEVGQHFSAGIATEHSYRPALTDLLKALLPKFIVMNEPARIECGAPDLILARDANGIPVSVAFVEAKDVGDSDLDGNRQHKEQFNRYKKSLDHILFTDYLDFHLYEGETFVDSVRIAEIKGNKIAAAEDNILKFLEMVESLAGATPQKITSPKKMAEMMANKARLLADVVERTLAADTEKTGELAGQWKSFKTTLIHDLTERQFADIYAQTICYGMFAARLHDETPDTFSRDEAANLIPKTNPFLRKIFQSIAGYDVSESIVWIVDDLIESFRVTDIHKVMANFGKSTAQTDSMIHFYEDFLRCYDPKQKKACGVYYTPEPVVKFIVNAVDEILQKDFNMPMGLADTSKVQLDRIVDGTSDKKSKDHKVHEMREYHKVQILDPATGTGTFLAEAVRKIHSKMEGQQGAWQSYVEEHLLPRLNGFEFMMAPYAVAHLKLDMVLGETGYKAAKDKRLRIFLTNSLEECDPDTGTLFAQWLAQEANEANYIKRDTPVMVMIGNPPYSVSSSNKGEWIERLLEDYKKDLNERNIQPLSDDYIKFIRLAHYYVEKNGEGILAYISNNSFIDGIIHRQMRKELMNAFDSIYILDLHGNTRKKEVSPDGSKDENVFDIMQGVSINIFVKTKNNNSTRHSEQKASNPSCHSERSASTPARHSERSVSEVEESSNLANVYHFELFGKREDKYEYLRTHSFNDVPWTKLNPQEPQNFFVPKDFEIKKQFDSFIDIEKLMSINSSGVKTHHDKEVVSTSRFHTEFNLRYNYRPLDIQWINYDLSIVVRHRSKFMFHFINHDNLGLVLGPQGQAVGSMQWNLAYCSKHIVDTNIYYRGGGIVFPLYLYPTDEEAALGETRKPNLDEEIWRKMDKCIQIPDQVGNDDSQEHITTPEQIFDYIYGILHTPSYREKYKEFLKVDFPRIPYPENVDKFNQIVALGNKLRKLHLMEEIPQSTVAFNIPGDNLVSEIKYQDNCVYINKTQYFDNIPELAWNFYIGGYQPAQKWLKDRKGRTLSFDDIAHYRKIIAILIETENLMRQLDKV